MKAIRVFGVGLLLSGVITVSSAQKFFTWWLNDVSFHSFSMTMQTIAPYQNATTGFGGVALAVLMMFSLGAGFFLAATVYARIETRVLATLEAWQLRNDNGDRAIALRSQCLPWLNASKA